MNNFDLKGALAAWRAALLKNARPEAGDLAELESGLQDRYDEFLLKGFPPKEAFHKARLLVTPDSLLGGELAKANQPAGLGSALLANYLKIGWRNLRTRQWYNLTNFVCLTCGILTVALATLYLHYETNYDVFIPQVDRKYRVGINLRSQGYSLVSFPNYNQSESAEQLNQINGFRSLPGVDQSVQFGTFPEKKLLRLVGREITASDLLETNTPQDFLDYFGWSFLAGSAEAFATNPNTALLTEQEAIRFWGADWRDRDPLSQTLRVDTTDFSVAGVLADVPPDAHFNFSVALHVRKINYWGARTYLKLAAGADPQEVSRRANENFASVNTSLAENELFGGILLQPLRSLHLNSDLLYELKPPGDVRYLYIIGLITLIVLLLTVSNYTNLSVVMNAGRAREIGMRKIFGASDGQIAGQFVIEALLLSLLTLPIVFLGLYLLLPPFNTLMGIDLALELVWQPNFLLMLLGITGLVGLLASVFPALFLARTQVQGLFKGRVMQDSGGGFTTRRVIISLQFILLIGLSSLALFVNRQLAFIQDKDLGYATENLLYVNLNADSNRFATFRSELLRMPEVTGVGSGDPMAQNPYNQLTYKLDGTEEVFDDARNIYLDYQALNQLGVRTSIPEYVADPENAPSRLVLINTTLADKLKNRFQLNSQELIGRTLIQEPEYVDEETGQVGFPYVIAGTFEDMYMFSLRERVDPMFMTVYKDPRYVYWASVSFQGTTPAAMLAKVRATYDELGLDKAFVHAFLDENLADLYVAERRIATLTNLFSFLAFLMAIIGLVALTAYLTALKRREIGIRIILGATPLSILRRFNREYLLLLGLALLIAVPLTWWGVGRWLEGFAYRISVEAWVFLLAGLITLVVASLAVSLVTWRAANTIPAYVLTRND